MEEEGVVDIALHRHKCERPGAADSDAGHLSKTSLLVHYP